jgi:hypothetical protein
VLEWGRSRVRGGVAAGVRGEPLATIKDKRLSFYCRRKRQSTLIEGRHDVIIHGCGYQTRLASSSLKPAPPPSPPSPPPPPSPIDRVAGQPAAAPASAPAAAAPVPLPGRFNAVFSNANSAHIQLRDFAVEADTDELGILIDGTGALVVEPGERLRKSKRPAKPQLFIQRANYQQRRRDRHHRKRPLPHRLHLARNSRQASSPLRIDDNRVAMQDLGNTWPAIWVSGQEIHIDRNFVSIQSSAVLREWLSASVANDLTSSAFTPGHAKTQATTPPAPTRKA